MKLLTLFLLTVGMSSASLAADVPLIPRAYTFTEFASQYAARGPFWTTLPAVVKAEPVSEVTSPDGKVKSAAWDRWTVSSQASLKEVRLDGSYVGHFFFHPDAATIAEGFAARDRVVLLDWYPSSDIDEAKSPSTIVSQAYVDENGRLVHGGTQTILAAKRVRRHPLPFTIEIKERE